MFDWNDEEYGLFQPTADSCIRRGKLTNIIWGEAGENGDHIVPYEEGTEEDYENKEWSQVVAANIKPTEQKTPEAKVDFHGRKLESSSKINTNEGISSTEFCMGTWPDVSLSTATINDQDSMDSEDSSNLAEITKYNSTSADTSQSNKDPEIFHTPHEGKEQGDFVDYSWANIGSFDDLDRIFSNDDPIFGHVNFGSADELWPSSKDLINSPEKSFPTTAESPSLGLGALSNKTEYVEIKTEYEQQDDQSFAHICGKAKDPASHDIQKAHEILDHVEYPGGESKPIIKDQTCLDTEGRITESNSRLAPLKVTNPNKFAHKGYRQKEMLRSQKRSEKKDEASSLQAGWFPAGNPMGQHKNQMSSSMMPPSLPSVLTQQSQLQGPQSSQYQYMSNPFVAPSAYGNFTNPYPVLLSNMQSEEFKHQPLVSGYEVSPSNTNAVNKSVDAAAKPLSMTPQEKIEKLRRRQQMQAKLAIQKQLQQLGHPVSGTDNSTTQKCPKENPVQHYEGVNFEDLSTLPSFDPNSPIEQDDSNMTSAALDDYSVEENVLYQLQGVIAKLDNRIRLCIRDSLFRLAQSAMHRHYAIDTSSSNKSCRDEHEVIAKEETCSNRNAKISDQETETNPIDRTVAHLLFHRPLELSGKLPDTPESPASTKLQSEHKPTSLANVGIGCVPMNSKITQQGSKIPFLDSSENASNYGSADGGAAELKPLNE